MPAPFFRRLARCANAGHPVAVDERVRGLPDGSAAARLSRRARFTLLAGTGNRCFLPSGRQRTHRWLEARRPDAKALHLIPVSTHMAMLLRRHAARAIYPRDVRAPAH